ncbi:ADP-heptose:LPS heptosyltransferase [Ulvibacter sp. MAR_2010_11]|nr:ADP-heptose:LPS heptosyltransferase [Ulvibacter sp. MAR_2010_11]
MGDVAMTIPVLRIFTQTYPNVKITVLSRVFFKPLFDDIPNVNFLEADVYGEHKGFGLLKLANEAKELGIDAVADLHNVIRSKAITAYLKMTGLQTATIDKGRAEKKEITQAKGAAISPLKTTHQRYADVFNGLGFPLELKNPSSQVRKQLTPRLLSLIGKHSQKAIGIAPFAAFEGKMYPIDLMQEVIAQLDALGKYRVFLFGGGKEEIQQLSEMALQYTSVANVAGQLTFDDELALISNLDVMLSMDSGNGHLAAMCGIPVVTLWGVTHPFAGFTPFNQPSENQLTADRAQYPLIPTSVYGNKFPEGYEKAMTTITPKKVVEKLLEIV